MCGVAGFYGDFGPEIVEKMIDTIAHRGPDGEGIAMPPQQRVAVAHRRLAIIDVTPAGAQPMWDSRRRACIVFNGEIYNYRELRAEPALSGVNFYGHSDTEVLLNLYIEKGESILQMLNGIFAFAIWDAMTKVLFVARDGMGVKPLYYAETANGFLFASELKTLMVCSAISKEINSAGLANYMRYLWSPAPATLVGDVKKLQPGTALRVIEGRVNQQWSFYRLPVSQPIERLTTAAAVGRVRDALNVAVGRQLTADVPVGAFLSGGLDSSSIVASASALSSQARLQCFTIALDEQAARREGMASDLPYAIKVARYLGVDLHIVHVGPEMADDLEKMIYHLDEPQADPAALNVYYIAGLARDHGIKVLLSGAGGDDLFTGYRRHRALMLEKYWAWLPEAIRKQIARAVTSLPARTVGLRRISRAFRYAHEDGDTRLARYFHWIDTESCKRLVAAEHRVGFDEEPLEKALSEIPDHVPLLNRMLYLECRYFLADHNLNYTDKMSMAAGVEVRVPFLDRDLVDVAFRLPIQYKQRGGVGKWILKRAMEGMLPDDVIYRPKTGFGMPLRAWLHGPLQTLLWDTLSNDSIRRRGLFDAVAVNRLMKLDRAGRVDASYPLFAMLCIELWCRIFLDRTYAA